MLVFLQWSCFTVLSLVSLIYTSGNYVLILLAMLRHRNYTLIPLIGGVAGCIASFSAPFEFARTFWYVPLILDPGTCLYHMTLILALVLGRKSNNEIEEKPRDSH